jgi:hypothetical protein
MTMAALTLSDIRRLEDDINSTLTAIATTQDEDQIIHFFAHYRVTIASLLSLMQDLLDQQQNQRSRRYLC